MMKNREVFYEDPTTTTIPNGGVTKVLEPRTQQEWDVLRYELRSFVCQGEYRLGLERILDTYLRNLHQPEQPAAWVSGFYGSGKSHFVRVLEYLWRDVVFPDGAHARGLARLPDDINALLVELTTAGRREGGLWSAAGTLGAGGGKSVRLALLAILFRSAGLSEQYSPARFVIWLRQNGFYEDVRALVEKAGKDFNKELNHMYVSPVLAESLLTVYPSFASNQAEAKNLLRAQYPNRDDISDEELLLSMEDVLVMRSATLGKLPCTLLIFDELQQFIGEDAGRTLQVQTIVEACSARFGSRVLFVATGQAALQATPQLSKLKGRFTVNVTLSDTDVERVVREVVLRKAQDKVPILNSVLDQVSGEIDRQLAGTRIGPRLADTQDLVPDYPLLPVRRRFWESVLRAIDQAGTAGQLRTQLRIVHDAARDVADQPLGTVVAGDYIYDQLKSEMLQSAILLRDVDAAITNQVKEGPDGLLRSRLCAAIFLVGQLPVEGVAATGVRATAETLADLLVENLRVGSTALRERIPVLLNDLVEAGTLIQVGDEYRLQTRESAEWEADYRARYARIFADNMRIASDRTEFLRNLLGETMRGVTFTQGVNKTPRKYELHFGAAPPATDTGAVPIWMRDEWFASERAVREDAQREGVESPIVFVFLPQLNADAVKAAIASQAAATQSLESKPRPTTPEGIEARNAMESRQRLERDKARSLLSNIISNGRIFQGGGIEVNEGSFLASIRAAIDAALIRLFPDFGITDVMGWDNVLTRASQGAPDALAVVGHDGDVEKHPAAKRIREYIGSTGKIGSEIRRHFMGTQYGWPQDAVDGSLLALVASGLVRASQNGQSVNVKGITRTQIGVTSFASEGVTISALQRIQLRQMVTAMGLPNKQGEEADAVTRVLQELATIAPTAGGDPPLPERPSTEQIDQLRALSGNDQLAEVHARREQLLDLFKTWTHARDHIKERLPRWQRLEELLKYAQTLPAAEEVTPQVEAICANRSLLDDPDPVPPLTDKLTSALRSALQETSARFNDTRQRELSLLQSSEEWQALPEADRASILQAHSLDSVPAIHIGTDAELLHTLEENSLADWRTMTDALPSRFAQAREEAARRTAPQAVRVYPGHATLRSPSEVEAYLERLRDDIMRHIHEGKPVIL